MERQVLNRDEKNIDSIIARYNTEVKYEFKVSLNEKERNLFINWIDADAIIYLNDIDDDYDAYIEIPKSRTISGLERRLNLYDNVKDITHDSPEFIKELSKKICSLERRVAILENITDKIQSDD